MSTAGMDRIEQLVRAIETAPESATRAAALELIQAVLSVHGEGLQRILRIAKEEAFTGPELVRIIVRDDLISSLLSLHDLHPDDLTARAEAALIQIRDTLSKQGAEVRLGNVSEEGVVSVRLKGASPGVVKRLRSLVEDAIFAAAPDAAAIVFEEDLIHDLVQITSWVPNDVR